MNPNEIRATVGSFWLNSLETELLGCIALALADISETLQDIRRSLAPTIGRVGFSGDIDSPGEERLVSREGRTDLYVGIPAEMQSPGEQTGRRPHDRPPLRRR